MRTTQFAKDFDMNKLFKNFSGVGGGRRERSPMPMKWKSFEEVALRPRQRNFKSLFISYWQIVYTEMEFEEIELGEKFENNEIIGDGSCKVDFDLQEKIVSVMEEGGDPRVPNFKILRTFFDPSVDP